MDESFPDGSHLVDTLNVQTKAGSQGEGAHSGPGSPLPNLGPCVLLVRRGGRNTLGASPLCSMGNLVLARVPKLANLSEI